MACFGLQRLTCNPPTSAVAVHAPPTAAAAADDDNDDDTVAAAADSTADAAAAAAASLELELSRRQLEVLSEPLLQRLKTPLYEVALSARIAVPGAPRPPAAAGAARRSGTTAARVR